MKPLNRWMPFLVAVLVMASLLAVRATDPSYLQAQRAASFDTLQRLWPRQMEVEQPVRIVDIDEQSLQQLGQWPWPRDRLAQLTRNLAEMGAAVIAFDIAFPEQDRLSPRRLAENPSYASYFKSDVALPDTDQEFASALASAPTVLAFARGSTRMAESLPLKSGIALTGLPVQAAPPRTKTVTANIEALETAATGIGSMNIDLAGELGVARSIPMLWGDGDRLFPTLSIEALRVAQGAEALVIHGNDESENIIEGLSIGAIEIPVSESGLFQLHYRKDDPKLYVSAAKVLDRGKSDSLRPLIDGHVVLVGTSAVGLLDTRTTSLGETVPGVSVHAQAIEQMLSGRFLTRPEWVEDAELLGAIMLSLLTAAVAALVRPSAGLTVGATSALAIAAATAWAFNAKGLLVDASFPLLLLTGTFLTSIAWRLLVTDRQGRMMRTVFGHYVAPAVLAEIEKNPEALKLGGEVREITVLFLDIANFTPLSEKLKPDELVSVVNGLWDVCSKEILAEQGTIDKFIGDAIMAFWNAPLACEAHQSRACQAALSIRDAVRDYNHQADVRTKLESINAWPLGIRVGIASGPACVGNMGSSDRFDYSVIGETVNTAARAESACKQIGHDIVVAGEVSPETSDLAVLSAGLLNLKGRSSRQPVTAIIGKRDMAQSASFQLLSKDLPILIRSKQKSTTKKALLKELALHHPAAARFLEAVPDRLEDYVAPN